MRASRICIRGLDHIGRQLIKVGKYLADRHYHAGLAGNISVRVSREYLLCTRHGADKGRLTASDFVLCDLDGNKVEGPGRPTSEMNMHLACYQVRPDVKAVVHAHPPTATAFAAASTPLDHLMLPEMVVCVGHIALIPYATPGSSKLAEILSRYLPSHDAFLLENHGALTLGRTLFEAATRMELVEHNARITLVVRQLGKPFALRPRELKQLLEVRKRINSALQLY